MGHSAKIRHRRRRRGHLSGRLAAALALRGVRRFTVTVGLLDGLAADDTVTIALRRLVATQRATLDRLDAAAVTWGTMAEDLRADRTRKP